MYNKYVQIKWKISITEQNAQKVIEILNNTF